MIAVIADDFTGAAEIAGISLRYFKNVKICFGEVESNGNENVMIVCTDSRSKENADAVKVTEDSIKKIITLKPAFIFKKCDSVLRGFVVDEMKVQMELLKFNTALIVPANPSFGRKITNGKYFINDAPIAETDFRNDPEFSIKSSVVKEILNNDDIIIVQKNKGTLPAGKIIIGETNEVEDCNNWAELITENNWAIGGGGDFYNAILGLGFKKNALLPLKLEQPFLYICGTNFKERKNEITEWAKHEGLVKYISVIYPNKAWFNEAINSINKNKKLIIAITDDKTEIENKALLLRNNIAKVVKQLLYKTFIKELLIEGGSTAAGVLEELQISNMQPINEIERGVVRIKTFFLSPSEQLNEIFITVKPGSYDLPKAIKKIFIK